MDEPASAREHDPLRDIEQIAARDHRTASDALADALAFYALLPSPARRALKALRHVATTDEQAAVGRAAGEAIVQVGLDVARRGMAEAMPDPFGADASEDDIAAEAIRLVDSARAERR